MPFSIHPSVDIQAVVTEANVNCVVGSTLSKLLCGQMSSFLLGTSLAMDLLLTLSLAFLGIFRLCSMVSGI